MEQTEVIPVVKWIVLHYIKNIRYHRTPLKKYYVTQGKSFIFQRCELGETAPGYTEILECL